MARKVFLMPLPAPPPPKKKGRKERGEGRAEANLRRCLCFWQLSQEPNRNSCAIMQLLIETQSHF